jgi:uncharacterized membrane protein
MNKSEYMKALSHNLRRLPKEDYDRAVEYFEEYFAEAGPENESQAIEDLGDPGAAASELLMNLAEKTSVEQPRSIRRGLSAIWIGILGICAAPIALPLAFALIVVLLSVALCILLAVLCVFIGAVSVAATGVIGVAGGVWLLFHAAADGIATLGIGLIALGLGIIVTYGAFCLSRWTVRKLTLTFGKIIKKAKGGRSNEANH